MGTLLDSSMGANVVWSMVLQIRVTYVTTK